MSKTAFLFAGQGAQAVGMGRDFAEAFRSAAELYQEAGRVLGWDVARLCFEGPREELERTSRCQPAILATSLAILAAMRESGAPEVEACGAAAGLSLGEYTALVMAGALQVPDALRLVQKRGEFMEQACARNPGAMASVLGLEDGIVEAICAQVREREMVVAANYNCPGQVVISGTRRGVEQAAELARQRGARRVVWLQVSGAFHSPLMAPAAGQLEEELERTPIAPCRIPVISNVTAAPVTSPQEIRSVLARQLRAPVRWSQSMSRLVDDGYRRFVEVGPGKVLSGLMRRIAPKCQVENVSTAEALKSGRRS